MVSFSPTDWGPLVNFGADLVSMLLGGLAAGMVLFIVSVGLSVTMGLMGFVNLAHGGFAMLGGYVIVLTMRNWGIGFIPAMMTKPSASAGMKPMPSSASSARYAACWSMADAMGEVDEADQLIVTDSRTRSTMPAGDHRTACSQDQRQSSPAAPSPSARMTPCRQGSADGD